jgi:hypothetical protein
MLQVAQMLLTALAQIAPMLTSNAAIAKVITTVSDLVPVVIKEAQDLKPLVDNIIAALKGNDAVTDEQLAQLDALETKIDADFDAEAKRVEAEETK